MPRAPRIGLRTLAALACLAVAGRWAAAQPFANQPPFRPALGNPAMFRPTPLVNGNPFARGWRTEEFDAGPVNYCAVQHPRSGYMYVGNTRGVLEFDGAQWRLIPLPKGGAAETLAIDADGRIWVGATNEFARLEPDLRGGLRARTIVKELPGDDFSYSSEAIVAPDGLWFGGLQYIVRVGRDDEVSTWHTAERFGTIWWMDGAIHTSVSDREVVRIEEGGRFVTVIPRSEIRVPPQRPNPLQVFAARDVGGGDWILLTALGPMRWRRDLPGWRMLPEAMPLFREGIAVGGMFLADGRMALSMIRPAIVLCAPDGRVERIMDRMPALFSARMTRMAEDAEGGLWLPMREQIFRLDLRQRFARHENLQALQGMTRQILRAHGQLFIAHSEGVAAYREGGRFVPTVNLLRGADALAVIDGRLFAAAAGLVEIFDDLNTRSWSSYGLTTLAAARRGPPGIFAGDAKGVWIFRSEGEEWREDGRIKDILGDVDTVYDSGDGWVWTATADGRIWRADFREGRRLDAPVRVFGPADGVRPLPPGGRIQFFQLGGSLVATTADWVLRHDAGSERFVPETRIAGLTNTTHIGAEAIGLNSDGTVWLRLGAPDRRILQVRPDNTNGFRTQEMPALLLREFQATSLYQDDVERTLWLSGADFLVSAALDWQPPRAVPPAVARIRRVISGGEVLGQEPLRAATPLALTRGQTSLRIEYAAALYSADHRGRSLVQYRTRLDGLDRDWTPWSAEPWRDFTNLPYRDFTFRLQARDPAGRVSEEATLPFTIAAPWWLRRSTIAAYVLLAALLVGGLVKLRTRRLQHRASELERIIAARTAELAEKNVALRAQNEELARLRQLETEEKIAARLAEEKARLEVLRYQLNPHFLYNALNSVYGLVLTTPRAAAGMVLRLAEFCRATLTRDEDETTTVGTCFDRLGLYLAIEKVRWNDSLQIEMQIDDDARDRRVPPFLLQPLVENAIKYGGNTSPDELKVRLTARVDHGDGDWLRLEVANTGHWVEPEVARASGNTGVGLSNLRQRLQRAFPNAHTFSTRAADGWVTVSIRIALAAVPLPPRVPELATD